MAKSSNPKQDQLIQPDQPEYWDVCDPADQTFWQEFFQIEEMLDLRDELEPTQFSITVQNHATGEVKSFSPIRLISQRQKIRA